MNQAIIKDLLRNIKESNKRIEEKLDVLLGSKKPKEEVKQEQPKAEKEPKSSESK